MNKTRLALVAIAFASVLLTEAHADIFPAAVLNRNASYTLPTLSVKLTQGGSMRATVLLMGADAAVIEPKLPQITESLSSFLKEAKPSDLAGPAGMDTIKQGIVARINPIISPATVSAVTFKEMIVQ